MTDKFYKVITQPGTKFLWMGNAGNDKNLKHRHPLIYKMTLNNRKHLCTDYITQRDIILTFSQPDNDYKIVESFDVVKDIYNELTTLLGH